MIRSKYFFLFLEVLFLASGVLHTKRKRCGQMGPTLLQSQVVSTCQSFRLQLYSFFLVIVLFLAFLDTERGVAI